MGDYIRVPVTYDQNLQLIPIVKLVKELSVKTTFLAGSSALRIFLGKPLEFSNDVDLWVNSAMSLTHWFRRIRDKRHCFTSQYAVNIPTKELPIQVIPIKTKDIEKLLDTFDLTSSAIGIVLTDDNYEFVVHKDIYVETLNIVGNFVGMGRRMGIIEIDDRGRITIPKDERERLGLTPGKKVLIREIRGHFCS